MKSCTSWLFVCFFVYNFSNYIVSMQSSSIPLQVLSKSHETERKTIFIRVPYEIYQSTNSTWDRIFEYDFLLNYIIEHVESDSGVMLDEHIQEGFFKLSCDAKHQSTVIAYLKDQKNFISDVWQEDEFSPALGQMYAVRQEYQCRDISPEKRLALDRQTAHLVRPCNTTINKNEASAYIQFALEAWFHYKQTHKYEHKDYHSVACGFIGLLMKEVQQAFNVRAVQCLRSTLYKIAYANTYSFEQLADFFTQRGGGRLVQKLWSAQEFKPEAALEELKNEESSLAISDVAMYDDNEVCNIF